MAEERLPLLGSWEEGGDFSKSILNGIIRTKTESRILILKFKKRDMNFSFLLCLAWVGLDHVICSEVTEST